MGQNARTAGRRTDSLSRDRIIDAAIELLDDVGEAGLTFRALSDRLATGPGAIYWHISNKTDLLTASCDAVIARTLHASQAQSNSRPTPQAKLRALAVGVFDALDEHPWVGSALIQVPGQGPMLRLLEGIGQQVRALGVAERAEWDAASALLHYIVGVSGQNAANAQYAQAHSLDRANFLEGLASSWSQLDPELYPFARSIAPQLGTHDDRADFLAGIDLILLGIAHLRPQAPPSLKSL